MAEVHSADSQPAGQLAAPLPALARQQADRSREPLWPAGALGDAAVAEPRPHLASGARHHGALEPVLRGGPLRRLPWPSDPIALADAGASQRQRQR